MLSDEQQKGAIALAALNTLAGQDDEVSDARVRELLNQVHEDMCIVYES
jgi:hypothetical protein